MKIEIERIEISSDLSVDLNEIVQVSNDDLSYSQFFTQFMLKNVPVLLKGIKVKTDVSENWFVDGKLQLRKMKLENNQDVPVANCSKQYFDSHEKTTMKFGEFLKYWEARNDNCDLLYLKDFHLKQEKPELDFYNVPCYFASDWLNEFLIDRDKDDYRFIYIGPKNTW